jgi:hypothetical protein
MTRNISTSMENAIAADEMSVALLLELQLDSGTTYLHSGHGDLSYNGQTWKGVGAMGSISGVKENTSMSDGRITATLSHVPIVSLPDFVTEFSDNDPVGRAFNIYLAFLDADGKIASESDDVVQITGGFIDAVEMTDGGGAAGGADGGIALTLASEAALLGRTRGFRLTDQHQQRLFPGDKAFEFVTDTNLGELRWGQTNPQTLGGGGGGSNSGFGGGSPPFRVQR